MPDNAALQYGKEFGNRAQCNPTYYNVGALVKHLVLLRDKHGMTPEEIVRKYVFVMPGACGPCRFGMYVTEYRKALRDAGFDGFRVMLFQQTGGLSQTTGDDPGLDMNPAFFIALLKAIVAGDVLNAMGYRLRPYEVEPGATDRAMSQAKKICHDALENRKNILHALWKSKPLFEAVVVDRTRIAPKASIIGEFWAMTTEGDGNYQLQRFLEGEGAECDIQLVTAWILYNIWESRNDTRNRAELRHADHSTYGLGGMGPFDVAKRLFSVGGADLALRACFQVFAHALGLYGYKLADMDKVADVSAAYYNNDLRGGEGHMEVGKLILNVLESKAHLTVSVKPFGCMPSARVSDGVQSAITEKLPGTIYCAVETSGDGRVNFYSRVQMYLFKAKQSAAAEYDRALAEHGVTVEQVRAFLDANPRFASPLHKAPHAYAGTAADFVAEVAPYITMTRGERMMRRARALFTRTAQAAEKAPHLVVHAAKAAVERAPVLAAKVREDSRHRARSPPPEAADCRRGGVSD